MKLEKGKTKSCAQEEDSEEGSHLGNSRMKKRIRGELKEKSLISAGIWPHLRL